MILCQLAALFGFALLCQLPSSKLRGLFLVCHRTYVVMLLKVALLPVHLLALQPVAPTLSCCSLAATMATLISLECSNCIALQMVHEVCCSAAHDPIFYGRDSIEHSKLRVKLKVEV